MSNKPGICCKCMHGNNCAILAMNNGIEVMKCEKSIILMLDMRLKVCIYLWRFLNEDWQKRRINMNDNIDKDKIIEELKHENYIKNKSESDEQTTKNKSGKPIPEDKCDTMVKEIREYCRKNHCAICEAFTRFGCIFMTGYPDQWITTKEADGDMFLKRRIK